MLQPFNRHILITPEFVEREKKKEQSTILLPDDYTKVEGKYCSAVVTARQMIVGLTISQSGAVFSWIVR